MKTIEEAAEYYSRIMDNEFESSQGFIAGVEFAQRWIDVKDELPEQSYKTETRKLYEYIEKKFLIKTNNGNHTITTRSRFNGGNWYWNGSSSFDRSITHWRPIELKNK